MGTLTALWGGSVCQVGNLFGKYRSIIITLYNGAFDSSSAIFLIIKVGMGWVTPQALDLPRFKARALRWAGDKWDGGTAGV